MVFVLRSLLFFGTKRHKRAVLFEFSLNFCGFLKNCLTKMRVCDRIILPLLESFFVVPFFEHT